MHFFFPDGIRLPGRAGPVSTAGQYGLSSCLAAGRGDKHARCGPHSDGGRLFVRVGERAGRAADQRPGPVAAAVAVAGRQCLRHAAPAAGRSLSGQRGHARPEPHAGGGICRAGAGRAREVAQRSGGGNGGRSLQGGGHPDGREGGRALRGHRHQRDLAAGPGTPAGRGRAAGRQPCRGLARGGHLLSARGKAVAHACKAPVFRIYCPSFSHDPLSGGGLPPSALAGEAGGHRGRRRDCFRHSCRPARRRRRSSAVRKRGEDFLQREPASSVRQSKGVAHGQQELC